MMINNITKQQLIKEYGEALENYHNNKLSGVDDKDLILEAFSERLEEYIQGIINQIPDHYPERESDDYEKGVQDIKKKLLELIK